MTPEPVTNKRLAPHFMEREFDCPCCGFVMVDPKLVTGLEDLRGILNGWNSNIRILINSGYRCTKHNKEVGGVKNSQHPYGRAVDIVVKSGSTIIAPADVMEVAKRLYVFYNGGIGVYRTYLHLDVRGKAARW